MWTSYRVFFAAIVLVVISYLLQKLTIYDAIDKWATDSLHAIVAQERHFDDVVVIDVDEESIYALESQLGSWPYHRGVYALITDYLSAVQARVIAFDVMFSEPKEGDAVFAESLANAGNVVLASRGLDFAINHDAGELASLEQIALGRGVDIPSHAWNDYMMPDKNLVGAISTLGSSGIITVPTDNDGVIRTIPLIHSVRGYNIPSLPLAAMFRVTSNSDLHYDRKGRVVSLAGHAWSVDSEGRITLQYPRNLDALTVIPFYKVVLAALGTPEYEEFKGLFRNKTVFIGSSAGVLGDFAMSPIYGRTAGLGILSIAYLNLAHDLMFKPKTWWIDLILLVIGAATPLFFIVGKNRRPWQIIAISMTGMAATIAASYLLLSSTGQITSATFVILLNMALMITVLIERYSLLMHERQKLYFEKKAADEANQLKSQFLSHITHELRTPLTSILGYTQMLMDADIDGVERNRRLGIIKSNGNHLMELINNLLDKAKIQSGKLTLDLAPVRIKPFVGAIAETFQPVVENKGIVFDVVFGPDIPDYLLIDDLRVKQIILNLCSNAIKFTDLGGVTLHTDYREQRLLIAVKDTGPGMEAEALSRIFEAFEQSSSKIQKSHGGTGLGLNISSELAKLMGGQITVQSEPGRGTEFVLDIPAESIEQVAEEDNGRVSSTDVAEHDLHGVSVLIVDDTVFIREMVAAILKSKSANVLLAENGQQAVEIALREMPSLILMDREMPLMNGLEATRSLRNMDYQGCIIAMTANSDDELTAMTDAGCNGYIYKPIELDNFFSIINTCLESAR